MGEYIFWNCWNCSCAVYSTNFWSRVCQIKFSLLATNKIILVTSFPLISYSGFSRTPSQNNPKSDLPTVPQLYFPLISRVKHLILKLTYENVHGMHHLENLRHSSLWLSAGWMSLQPDLNRYHFWIIISISKNGK